MSTAFNRNAFIGTSTFTFGWLLDSFQNGDKVFQSQHATKTVSKITCCETSGNKGLSSKVYRCVLQFTDGSEYSSILKVPGSERLAQVTTQTEGGVNDACVQWDAYNETSHAYECKFFTELAPKLDVPMPKAFSTQLWNRSQNIQGCIHMTDLSTTSTSIDLFTSATMPQINAVVRELAHLHKEVLRLPRESWEGQFLKNQTAASIICSNYEMAEKHVRGINFCKDRVNALLDRVGLVPSTKKFVDWVHTDVYKNLNMRPVIAFGDLQSNNLLWQKNANGEVSDKVAAFIDFQLVHEGSPMNDLVRYLTLSVDGITRRRAEKTIFTDYHKLLSSELSTVGIEMPYTVDDLKTAYEYMFIALGPQWVIINGSFLTALSESEPAAMDVAMLRMIHCLEDVACLLDGKYAHLKKQFAD